MNKPSWTDCVDKLFGDDDTYKNMSLKSAELVKQAFEEIKGKDNMKAIKEMFTNEIYLGKIFDIMNKGSSYDYLYPCVKEALNDIASQDNNKILISGDIGSGKTVLAFCTLALNLFKLSHKTNEEVATELGTRKKEYTLYLGLDKKLSYGMWENWTLQLIDHFRQQDYNRFDWDRFIIVDDPTDSNKIFSVISNYEADTQKICMMTFNFLEKSSICKYILIDDRYSEFYRTNMRREVV